MRFVSIAFLFSATNRHVSNLCFLRALFFGFRPVVSVLSSSVVELSTTSRVRDSVPFGVTSAMDRLVHTNTFGYFQI
jgi:hypothetical protein